MTWVMGFAVMLASGCLRLWDRPANSTITETVTEAREPGAVGVPGTPYHPREDRPTPAVEPRLADNAWPPRGNLHDPPREEPCPPANPAPQDLPKATVQTATMTLQPTPTPDEPLVVALRELLNRHPAEALEQLRQYDPTDQELLRCLLPLAAHVARGGLEHAAPGEVSDVLDQLHGLERSLAPRAALRIDKMCFCRQIEDFGKYTRLPEDHAFSAGLEDQPGELVQVYVELRNFASEPSGPTHKMRLASTVEIFDYHGQRVWGKFFPSQPDLSRTPRQDYYINYRFCVPPRLPPGSYILWIQVKDLTGQPGEDVPAHRIARRSLDFRVTGRGAAPGLLRGPDAAPLPGQGDEGTAKLDATGR
jgi:hypothetical protein